MTRKYLKPQKNGIVGFGLRRKPLRKVAPAKSLIKKAEKRLWTLCREIILRRDGGCVLKNLVPLKTGCTEIRQADHLIKKCRGNILTKYDLRNLNELCSGHNCARNEDTIMVAELIRITNEKHGQDTFNELCKLKQMGAIKVRLEFLEEKIKDCEEILNL